MCFLYRAQQWLINLSLNEAEPSIVCSPPRRHIHQQYRGTAVFPRVE